MFNLVQNLRIILCKSYSKLLEAEAVFRDISKRDWVA